MVVYAEYVLYRMKNGTLCDPTIDIMENMFCTRYMKCHHVYSSAVYINLRVIPKAFITLNTSGPFMKEILVFVCNTIASRICDSHNI